MKKILFILIVFFLSNCTYPAINRTTIVQTCLDSLRRNNYFDFLDHTKIILVKNANSSGLNDLYWGSNKIAVRDTTADEIKVYVPGDAISNKRYLIINRLTTDNNNARVELEFPNTRVSSTLDMVRNDKGWRVKHFDISID